MQVDEIGKILKQALALHLQQTVDPCRALWVDWNVVADEVMEFMYGEEDHPGPSDRGADDNVDLPDPDLAGRDRPSLLGVVPSPEPCRCHQGFVALGGPQSLTAEYVPAPKSCCGQTTRFAQLPDEVA